MTNTPKPDADTLARWWVQLNSWVWPADLDKPNPPGGMTDQQYRYALRGAFAVVDALVDQEQANALWQDETARAALLAEGEAR